MLFMVRLIDSLIIDNKPYFSSRISHFFCVPANGFFITRSRFKISSKSFS